MNENQREFLENCKKNNVIGKIQINYNLSKYTWFGVAGNAEIFYMPSNFEELAKVLEINRDKLPVTVIGAGSNIIIRDGGIFGLVIKLGKEFSQITLHKECIEVGAATYDKVLSNYCQKNEIGGMEFYFGIPGTLGGAVRMNAGCYNSETKDIFIKAKCVDYSGQVKEISNSKELFSYRKINIPQDIIICDVYIQKKYASSDSIALKMKEVDDQRKKAQPQQIKTAGSTFKNPKDQTEKKAWEIIEEAGLKNFELQGISFSSKHSNFIVNNQTKSANLIEDFGEYVRSDVKKKLGISLNWEIKILGER